MRFSYRAQQVNEVIRTYNYPLPFSEHLKHYFKRNPKLGSRDRRILRELCYAWFRVGRLVSRPFEEALAYAVCVTANTLEYTLEEVIDPSVIERFALPVSVEEKFSRLQEIFPNIRIEDLYPFHELIAEQFMNEEFYYSFLHQPFVWIRIKEGLQEKVADEFNRLNILFEQTEKLTWKLSPEAKLNETEAFKKGCFRIQDYSSQHTGDYFQPSKGEVWWDCCAGAGGKGLALIDRQPDITLYASDKRESILENLRERHRLNGTKHLHTFQADLEKPLQKGNLQFDGIIADVPCTGSGTWARNPESLVYFDKRQIVAYTEKQEKILTHALPFLKKGKPLVYITCSIFRQENELLVEKFCQTHPVRIDQQKYFEGYRLGAENMFLCRLIKTE
jgi:16S rRNA (cytosine967-C5)-methyltransferase